MAFFEDLGKKLSETGSAAADKAKEVAQVTKLKSKISEEERNIKQQYIQIGKAYVEAHKEDGGEYAEMIEAIKTSEAAIAELEEQIKVAKGE